MSIVNRVQDWGGFEKFVAKLHETGAVTVEHDAILVGRSGAPRQIDVLIRHKEGLYEHLIIAECKYWNSNVTRAEVDALATSIREVGAARGVIFSTKGFQSGAITQAKHENIDLYVVRDLTPEEWGLPGAVVDLFLQVVQPGVGGITCPNASAVGLPPGGSANLNFSIGTDGNAESSTPTLNADGSPGGKDVEKYILDGIKQGFERGLKEFGMMRGSTENTGYVGCPVTLNFTTPLKVPYNDGILFIPSISIEMAIKVSQSRVTVNRAKNYQFAVALDNLVTGTTSTASRALDASSTEIGQVATEAKREGEEPLVNGTLMRVSIKGYFPYEELSGLQQVPIESVRRPFVYVPPDVDD